MKDHFHGLRPEEIVTAVRIFPIRMRPDLQQALDELFRSERVVGVHRHHGYGGTEFPDLWEEGRWGARVGPLQYVEVDIGEARPVRCVKSALWFIEREGVRHTVLLTEAGAYANKTGIQVEIALPAGEAASDLAQQYFSALDEAVVKAGSYRGKVLSLKGSRNPFDDAEGIQVHKLRGVARDEIVLPESTLALLERNVFGFFEQRAAMARLEMSIKKGLLFYGPPGTGKTHTIHYLATRLEGHTTLLITAEQFSMLPDYMALARLLQPSVVVMEDADLIAKDRARMGRVGEEVLLNQLLNEMDGLKEDAEILFILTTNRPEALETALAARPGRVDQAIEFPLPDDAGRAKLVSLYAKGLELPPELTRAIVARTEKVSPSFIKELMRRAAQYSLAAGRAPSLGPADVESALEEMLIAGGRLNVALLGGDRGADTP